MKRTLSLLIMLLMSGSVLIQAQFMGQQPMNGQTFERRGRDSGQSRESRGRIRLVNELLLHLDVSDEQYDQMFPIIRSYYESKDELTDKRMDIMNKLISSIETGSIDNADSDADEYMEQVDEVEKLSKDLLELHADLLKQAKKLLDERQYTKLAMFDERINRWAQEMRSQGMIRWPFPQFNNDNNNINTNNPHNQ